MKKESIPTMAILMTAVMLLLIPVSSGAENINLDIKASDVYDSSESLNASNKTGTKPTEIEDKSSANITLSSEEGLEDNVSINVLINGSDNNDSIQMWAKDTKDNWYDIVETGWGPSEGINITEDYNKTTEVFAISNKSKTYNVTIQVVNTSSSTAFLNKSVNVSYGIQTGIDSSVHGDIIEVAPGTYNESVTIDVPKITIESSGSKNKTNISYEPDSATGTPTVEIIEDNVTFSGFTVKRLTSGDRGIDSNHAQGIKVASNNATIRNNIITGNATLLNKERDYEKLDGLMVIDSNRGNTSNITLENNCISNFYTGLVITTFYGNSSKNIQIENNTASDNRYGFVAKTHASDEYVYNISGLGNDFTGNDNKSIYIPKDTFQGYNNVNQAYVNEIAFNGPIHVEDGDSIQTAIDVSAENTTIDVDSGTYNESLAVDVEKLKLKGKDKPTINCSETESKNTLDIKAENVTIDGFTIERSAVPDSSNWVNAIAAYNSSVIKNNEILGNNTSKLNYSGITTTWADDKTVIENNTVTGFHTGILASHYSAPDKSYDVNIQDNILVENYDGLVLGTHTEITPIVDVKDNVILATIAESGDTEINSSVLVVPDDYSGASKDTYKSDASNMTLKNNLIIGHVANCDEDNTLDAAKNAWFGESFGNEFSGLNKKEGSIGDYIIGDVKFDPWYVELDPPEKQDPRNVQLITLSNELEDEEETSDSGLSVTARDRATTYEGAEVEISEGKGVNLETPATSVSVELEHSSISTVEVETENEVEGAYVEIKELNSKPDSTETDAPGNVYKYMSIEVKEVDPENIDNTRMDFSVSRDWLQENEVEPEEVALARYVDGEWTSLETSVVSESDDAIELEAISPGFSNFAITTVDAEDESATSLTAEFSAEPTSGKVPLEVTFTDKSENAEEYEWDFGNGETSTQENPTYTYEEAGEYNVTLTVSNDAGEDTAQTTVTVGETEEPASDEPGIPGFEAIFGITGLIAVGFLIRRR